MQGQTSMNLNTEMHTSAAGRAAKGSWRAGELVQCALFAALMAVGAFMKIMLPLGPFQVTFSLQIFFAVMAGLLLGARLGFFSVLAYLLLGLVGFPVYAHGGGLGYLAKPTFGFLIGFAAAALVTGLAQQALAHTHLPHMARLLAAVFAGEMVYYACGLLYYGLMVNFLLPGAGIGLFELLRVWFLGTVAPDYLLCALAALLARRLQPALRRYTQR